MKNKIFEYFFMLANVILILGITISSILIIQDAKKVDGEQVNGFLINPLNFLPYIICLFISIILMIIFIIMKQNYFKLIRMHVKDIWIYLHYISCLIILLNYIFTSLMFIFAPSMTAHDIKTFYLFVLIAITMLISLVATGLNSYSKIKIKIELAIRRTEGKEEKKEEETQS